MSIETSADFISQYIQRKPINSQLIDPVCGRLEPRLLHFLLTNVGSDTPITSSQVNTTLVFQNEVHLIQGLAIQKRKGLKSWLMLTGTFAGFMFYYLATPERPLLKESNEVTFKDVEKLYREFYQITRPGWQCFFDEFLYYHQVHSDRTLILNQLFFTLNQLQFPYEAARIIENTEIFWRLKQGIF